MKNIKLNYKHYILISLTISGILIITLITSLIIQDLFIFEEKLNTLETKTIPKEEENIAEKGILEYIKENKWKIIIGITCIGICIGITYYYSNIIKPNISEQSDTNVSPIPATLPKPPTLSKPPILPTLPTPSLIIEKSVSFLKIIREAPKTAFMGASIIFNKLFLDGKEILPEKILEEVPEKILKEIPISQEDLAKKAIENKQNNIKIKPIIIYDYSTYSTNYKTMAHFQTNDLTLGDFTSFLPRNGLGLSNVERNYLAGQLFFLRKNIPNDLTEFFNKYPLHKEYGIFIQTNNNMQSVWTSLLFITPEMVDNFSENEYESWTNEWQKYLLEICITIRAELAFKK